MNFTEFKNELNLGLEKLNIFLEEEQINQFYKYMNILIEWNKNINLTAITDPKEVILKHFIDSIYVLKNIEISSNSSVIDIGTGAGFPGIPLKIVRKDLNVTLLDSLNKRLCNFKSCGKFNSFVRIHDTICKIRWKINLYEGWKY